MQEAGVTGACESLVRLTTYWSPEDPQLGREVAKVTGTGRSKWSRAGEGEFQSRGWVRVNATGANLGGMGSHGKAALR